MYNFPAFRFLSLLILLASFSCSRPSGPSAFPEEAQPYISGFSSGILSKAGPVRIRFTQSPISAEQIGSLADSELLQLSPAASGDLYWEDARTLRFEPEVPMKSGQVYTATLQLERLFPGTPKEAQQVSFSFNTRDQAYDLAIEGLFPTVDNRSEVRELKGAIYTADIAEPEAVEQIVQARQENSDLEIQWVHTSDQLEHRFTISGIQRTNEPGKLTLSWNGKPIGVNESGTRTIEIPALGDFRIIQAQVVQDPQQSIVLQFSDPLDAGQDLAGLIRLSGYSGNLRFLIDGTQVIIYPGNKLSGVYQVVAEAGILSSDGIRMKNQSAWDLSLNLPDPAVRLVGRGVIMPESEGLIFPFEAVGLNAVLVEVFKIYDDNILQFLQTNNLDGSDELYRVGKLVLQHKVDLHLLNPTAEASTWGRYALDLGSMFEQDPDAIYQVRIGFMPSFTQFTCANEFTEQEDELDANFSAEEELTSLLDNWYGFEGYYPDYRWEDRDDPCKPAFYNYEKFVRRNVLTSNLGLMAKGNDQNQFLVTATDLRTTRSVSGATITFYDYYQQPLGSGKTDGNGTLRMDLNTKPFIAVVEKGDQKGYLRLQDGNALSLSRFDVSGTRAQKGLKGYLYTERGAWRPGDSVHLNLMLEDASGSLPQAYPVVLELYNPRNQLVEKRSVLSHVGRIYDLSFSTKKEDPTGLWRAIVKAGGATFEKGMFVETIKPNRLQMDLDFGTDVIQLGNDRTVQATVSAKWLHGAPASGLEAIVEAQLSSKNTSFPKYSTYAFDDPTRRTAGRSNVIFNGTLDNGGNASFSTNFFPRTLPSGKISAQFRTRVFEKGGDFSTALQTKEISPYNAYVGVELPENEYRQKRLSIDESGNLNVVVVDAQGNPLANRTLTAEVYRVEWRWWWERNSNNVSTYNYNRNLEEQQSATLRTNTDGQADWSVTLPQWGRYLVRVCEENDGHCTGDFLYVGYPYAESSDRSTDAALLAFTSDKETYAVDDEVELIIPAEENCRAFISLETGSDILETRWLNLKQGENRYSFTATPEMAPNVYAHVTLIQEHAQLKNDRPIRLYGVLPIPVEAPSTRLEPVIAAPAAIRPESEFTIEVAEKEGKPMAYTIAVVDEGLLGITSFRTPDPHGAFYAKEALGIKTWDVYDQVLGAYGGQLDRILSVGGGGAENDAEQQEMSRFASVVMHLGPFQLKKGQKASHQLQMPNYVGAVRTMVVAAQDGAYGSADETIPVKKPLMVLSTLPRVLGPGERVRIPVNVFAMDDKVKKVTVRLTESTGKVSIGTNTQRLSFQQPGNQIVYFDVDINETTGRANFLIEANGGGEQASQEVSVEIRNPNAFRSDIVSATLKPGESWSGTYQPIGVSNSREGYLEVSTLPPFNFGERLQYLIQYPYGCAEQTISAGFPQIYAGRVLELDANQERKMKQNVQATIQRMFAFQTGTGGFGYWPGDPNPNHWASNYGGHFLLEAKNNGYTVPTGLLTNWLDFQQKTARMWQPASGQVPYGYAWEKEEKELTQAYRLYTLALAQQPDMAAMNRLREQQNLSPVAQWRLAAAYALAGQTEVANRLVANLTNQVRAYDGPSRTYGSSTRNLAMIMETRVLLGQTEQAAELAQRISDDLGQVGWFSTQTTAYCLLAVGKLVGEGGVQNQMDFTYAFGSSNPQNQGSNSPVKTIQLLPAQLEGNTPIQLKNNGEGLLFVRLVSKGQPLVGQETSKAEGLRLTANYQDLNGNTLDPSNLPQGMDFIAQVEITHTGDRPYRISDIALDQIFPSGWEILNARFSGMNRFENSPSDYQDIRDDRVYTFFNLNPGEIVTYYVQLNAAYQGRYYLPGVHCEAMYNNRIQAQNTGQWVTVGLPEGI